MDMAEISSHFSWPNAAKAAISITFDDTRPSQLDAGVPILDRHNVKGTFYATLRTLEARTDEWLRAAQHGHEIGNHTTSHPCTGNFKWSQAAALENYTIDQMEADILNADKVIQSLIGIKPTTFAYPCGMTFVGRGRNVQSYVPLIAKHFDVGRCWRSESMALPEYCDLAQVAGIQLDNITWEQTLAHINTAASQGCWLAFVGHDISDQGRQAIVPDVLDRLCAYCKDPKNQLWIDTVDHVGAYVKNNNASRHMSNS